MVGIIAYGQPTVRTAAVESGTFFIKMQILRRWGFDKLIAYGKRVPGCGYTPAHTL